MSVLIVGSLAYDDLEMPSGTFENVVGGAATYASIAAALFCPVRLVGVIGEDFPDLVMSDLQRTRIMKKWLWMAAHGIRACPTRVHSRCSVALR